MNHVPHATQKKDAAGKLACGGKRGKSEPSAGTKSVGGSRKGGQFSPVKTLSRDRSEEEEEEDQEEGRSER